ncbi:hypothetical protein M1116_00435 [Patescibacteria group bacterium]|nr:hypothetical protein [Patescibacteria group bacterium]
MAGIELITALRAEINHYLGIPYFQNTGKFKNLGENAAVGKGSAKEIALLTVEYANKEGIKILSLTPQQIYNFQKKHHIGIDCSGLACHLIAFYSELLGKQCLLNPRRTSADMLTSAPISHSISLENITTGDLVRQKKGHHVVFVVEKVLDVVTYVDSSRDGRGVKYGQISFAVPSFFQEGVYRPNCLE